MKDLMQVHEHTAVMFPVVCPSCKGDLYSDLRCANCNQCYERDNYGYLDLCASAALHTIDTTPLEYAERQVTMSSRLAKEYLISFMRAEPCQRVLNVGCGASGAVRDLAETGVEAYGIDLPSTSRHWAALGHPINQFICADALNLPFPDNYFDLVVSLGVVEHIGTVDGLGTLSPNYLEQRAEFCRSLMRVVRPGGRILLSCPNKSFPLDLQHAPSDEAGRAGFIREWVWRKTQLNLHRPFGRYYLLSYGEVGKLFSDAKEIAPLPLRGFFGFSQMSTGWKKKIKSFVSWYLNSIPRWLLPTFVNPYMLVRIRK